jgi:UDP-N-acetylglucosamine/UDP-N-acetylgalactosamine diphosphorylase
MKILDENYSDLINDFHIAKKKIQSYNNGQPVTVSGVKFELFFNSLFLFAENLLLFNIDRSEEFAPIKNGDDATKWHCH